MPAVLAGTLALSLLLIAPSRAVGDDQQAADDGDPQVVAARITDAAIGNIYNITRVGDDQAFFVASTDEHGQELWTSDGTTEGTHLVADVRPGPEGSIHIPWGTTAVVDDVLYFIADDGVHGETLWRSDGTAAGTRLLKDVVPGSTEGAELYSLTQVGGTLYFLARVDTGWELWRSDGTTNGTTKIADAGACGSLCSVGPILDLGDRLVFVAGADRNGQLWASDGTPAGTAAIGPTTIRQLTLVGNQAFFTIDYGQLWQTDGTAAGTAPVPNAVRTDDTVEAISGLTDVDGELFYMASYFPAQNGDPYELRRAGTGGGTLIRGFDLADGGHLFPDTGTAAVLDGVFYFIPIPSLSAEYVPGRALWRSDGTAAGTSKIIEDRVYRLKATGDRLVFATADTSVGLGQWHVWTTDGTPAGTSKVGGPFKIPFGFVDLVQPNFTDIGEMAYFNDRDQSAGRSALWKIGVDSDPPETRIVDGFADGELVTSYPGEVRRFGFASVDDFTPTAGAVFQVKIDDRPWFDASNSIDFRLREFGIPAAEGPHTLSVRAVDAAGHVDPTPATRSFIVDLAPPDQLAAILSPEIAGTARVGARLTVRPGRWLPTPDRVGYQWLRDRVPITGATASSYVIKAADVAHLISVRERAEAADHLPTIGTSDPVRVAKARSTVRLKLKPAKVRASKRAKALVTVAGEAGVAVTGKVTVYAGKKKVGTATLSAGKATIRLARLPQGTYRLQATFAGSRLLLLSTSAPARLVVRR